MSQPTPGAFLARQDDDDDVRWNLTTAETQWNRGGRADAVVWLRRAADAAEASGASARADELRAHAAQLAQEVWAEANGEEEVVVELKRPLPPPPPVRSSLPPRPSFQPQPQGRQSVAILDQARARMASAPEIVLEEETLDPEELEELEELLEDADDELELTEQSKADVAAEPPTELEAEPLSVEISGDIEIEVESQFDLEDEEFENRITLVPAPSAAVASKSTALVVEAAPDVDQPESVQLNTAQADTASSETALLDRAPSSDALSVADSLPPLEFESELPPSGEYDLPEPDFTAPRVPVEAAEPEAVAQTDEPELDEPLAVLPSMELEAVLPSIEFEAVLPSIELEAVLPSMELEAVLPSMELEAVLPSIEFEAVLPSIELEAVEPEESVQPQTAAAVAEEATELQVAEAELDAEEAAELQVAEAEQEAVVADEPRVTGFEVAETEPHAEETELQVATVAELEAAEALQIEAPDATADALLEFDLDAATDTLDDEFEERPTGEPAAPEIIVPESAPEEPTLAESVAEELAPEKPVLAEPVAEELTPEEPAVAEPDVEAPAPEEPVLTEPTADLDELLPDLEAWSEGTNIDGVDLCEVQGFEDLPEAAQERLAGLARVERLNQGEEVGFFAAAVVTHGQVSVMPVVADGAGAVAVPPDVVFTRGTLEDSLELRMVARMDETRVAVWDAEQLRSVLDECPWVHDELRLAADHFLALCGATLGPLGERLDEALRATVFARLEVKVFLAGEELTTEGKPLPGLFIVGGGRVELSKNGQIVETKSTGDFLFANAIMAGQSSPATAVAGSGGALVLFASRAVAHELMISVPPLLEVLAG